MKIHSMLHFARTFVLFCCLACLGARAQDSTLAVWDFEDHVPDTTALAPQGTLTRALAELLIEQLLAYPGIRVVERTRLREILDEQKLGSSDLADEDTRLRLGRLAGAQHMVFGSLISLGGFSRVDVRLVSVATSQVLASHEASGAAADLGANMHQVAAALARSLERGDTVASGSGPKADVAQMARLDEGLALMDRKDFAAAIDYFQKLLRSDPGFTPAERQLRIALDQLSRQ